MKTNIKIGIVGIISIILAVLAVSYIIGNSVQVIIDPGHGGDDPGAVYNGRNEKDDNLRIALLVKDKLDDMGISAELTRKSDKFISLEKRCKIANSRKAELFVSLHRNSAENANGVEIWIKDDSPQKDSELAENILEMLDNAGISLNRGVKAGYAREDGQNYYINTHTDMPSCLVEIGFINNETDNKLFDENIDEYAQAIAEGINKSLN